LKRLPKAAKAFSLNSWVVPDFTSKRQLKVLQTVLLYRKHQKAGQKSTVHRAFTHSNVRLDNLSSPWINLPWSAQGRNQAAAKYPWINGI
jgi:hypothetical protein